MTKEIRYGRTFGCFPLLPCDYCGVTGCNSPPTAHTAPSRPGIKSHHTPPDRKPCSFATHISRHSGHSRTKRLSAAAIHPLSGICPRRSDCSMHVCRSGIIWPSIRPKPLCSCHEVGLVNSPHRHRRCGGNVCRRVAVTSSDRTLSPRSHAVQARANVDDLLLFCGNGRRLSWVKISFSLPMTHAKLLGFVCLCRWPFPTSGRLGRVSLRVPEAKKPRLKRRLWVCHQACSGRPTFRHIALLAACCHRYCRTWTVCVFALTFMVGEHSCLPVTRSAPKRR